MNIKCPKCRYEYSLREAMKDNAIIEVIKMQQDFAPHSKLVFEYAGMFDTTRPIKAAKLLRILQEVHGIWTAGKFSHYKTPYTISKDGIAKALTIVCSKSMTLDSHGYLVKVMIGIAEKEEEERARREEEALKRKERGLQAGVREGETMRGSNGVPQSFKDFFKGK